MKIYQTVRDGAFDLDDPSIQERFWAKVDRNGPNGCWIWQACKSSRQYGNFSLGRAMVSAHRIAYVMLVAPIADGLELDHLCRTHDCVRPDHLEPVPHETNVRRGNAGVYQRAKERCPVGHPYDAQNTRIRPSGARECKSCKRVRTRLFMREYARQNRRPKTREVDDHHRT